MKVTKAVIPCGGLGTRFLPITKSMPKELLPIVDTPSVAYIVNEAISSGITDIMIVISPQKEAIKHYFSEDRGLVDALFRAGKDNEAHMIERIHSSCNIVFAYQNQPKGSGDAVFKAKDFVGDDSFCLAWGDDVIYTEPPLKPVMAQLIEAYENLFKDSHIVGVQYLDNDSITKYGVANLSGQPDGRLMRCSGFVEKPPLDKLPSRYAAFGRYLLSKQIFEEIEKTKPGKNGELQLTDSINSLCTHSNVYAYDFMGKRYDTGDKLGFIQAVIEYGLKREFAGDLMQYLRELVTLFEGAC